MAQTAGDTALNAAGALREHASEIPGGDRSTRAATAVADRVEGIVNRATGQEERGFFERLSNALTNNKVKVAIGAALLAAFGVFVTQRALSDEAASNAEDLADAA